jgi:hypothetical protein
LKAYSPAWVSICHCQSRPSPPVFIMIRKSPASSFPSSAFPALRIVVPFSLSTFYSRALNSYRINAMCRVGLTTQAQSFMIITAESLESRFPASRGNAHFSHFTRSLFVPPQPHHLCLSPQLLCTALLSLTLLSPATCSPFPLRLPPRARPPSLSPSRSVPYFTFSWASRNS